MNNSKFRHTIFQRQKVLAHTNNTPLQKVTAATRPPWNWVFSWKQQHNSPKNPLCRKNKTV